MPVVRRRPATEMGLRPQSPPFPSEALRRHPPAEKRHQRLGQRMRPTRGEDHFGAGMIGFALGSGKQIRDTSRDRRRRVDPVDRPWRELDQPVHQQRVVGAGQHDGIGAGWMREEFEAIDAPDFDARGTVTDEYVRVFVELWTKDAPKFDGNHVRFSNIGFAPKPVQKPHPPIWVGGESGPALRRAGGQHQPRR